MRWPQLGFPLKSTAMSERSVALPPGRARLSASPELIGSGTRTNTIGMVAADPPTSVMNSRHLIEYPSGQETIHYDGVKRSAVKSYKSSATPRERLEPAFTGTPAS